PFPVRVGKPPELDPARLVGMEFQSKFPQPFPQILQESVVWVVRTRSARSRRYLTADRVWIRWVQGAAASDCGSCLDKSERP
ncbi:MAG TPA: hypothetical protein VIX19_14335, partial [Terriglobales bacterium]